MTRQEIDELELDPERAWRETGSRLRQKSQRRQGRATSVERSDNAQHGRRLSAHNAMEHEGRY